VAITLFEDATGFTFQNGVGQHQVSAITNVGDARLFDLKQGTGSLTTTGTKEGGTILFEHTVTFFVPNMSAQHMKALEELKNQNLLVICGTYANRAANQDGSNGARYIIGASEAFALEDDISNQQMFATLTSIEGSTGSAFGDENGVTVTITAQSGEMPRVFKGTFTPVDDGTVTIS
jgi:uncharacterized protein YciI